MQHSTERLNDQRAEASDGEVDSPGRRHCSAAGNRIHSHKILGGGASMMLALPIRVPEQYLSRPRQFADKLEKVYPPNRHPLPFHPHCHTHYALF